MLINKKPQTPGVDEAIDSVLEEMKSEMADSEGYSTMVDQLKKLYEIKSSVKQSGISADAKLAAAVSLLGILIIVGFEQTHIVTSKALGFVSKMR